MIAYHVKVVNQFLLFHFIGLCQKFHFGMKFWLVNFQNLEFQQELLGQVDPAWNCYCSYHGFNDVSKLFIVNGTFLDLGESPIFIRFLVSCLSLLLDLNLDSISNNISTESEYPNGTKLGSGYNLNRFQHRGSILSVTQSFEFHLKLLAAAVVFLFLRIFFWVFSIVDLRVVLSKLVCDFLNHLNIFE